MSCRSVSSYVQALQNPCIWTMARSFSFLVLCLLRNNWTPAMTGWTNLICLHLWDGSPNLSCWQKDLKPSKESHVTWYRSICRNSQWYSRYFPKTQRGGRNCSEQLVVCSEQPVTSGGAELAPRRKERWRGARKVLFIGLGELSWKVVVAFMDVLSPLVEIPWGRGPQLEPDVHKGTSKQCAETAIAGWPCGQEGFAEQLCREDMLPVWDLSAAPLHFVKDVRCGWWGGEGIYLVFEVCSLVVLPFLYCSLMRRWN